MDFEKNFFQLKSWHVILRDRSKDGSISIHFPAGNCMFKVNNKSLKTWCDICSKLTIKTPEQRQWRGSGVFIFNLEHISHFALVM